MSTSPTATAVPFSLTDAQSILTNLAGGGASAIILAVLFLLFKFCKDRRLRTHSGCIDLEFGSDSPRSFRVRRRGTPDPVPVLENPEAAVAPHTVKVAAGADAVPA